MRYPKSEKYDKEMLRRKIMGPNPIKLEEELLADWTPPHSATVLDLGSGTGITSVFLAKEYGCRVFAADLWSNPTDNMRFFEEMGCSSDEVIPIHADAAALPFAREFFDAAVCVDAYNYFGRSKTYLEEKLLPFVKPGGEIFIAVPGMKRDCHADLPQELLLSWTPEQLDYLHDAAWWRETIGLPAGAAVSVQEMQSNEEVWRDWLACDNPYAVGDRRAMEAGGGKYLNFISIIVKKHKA